MPEIVETIVYRIDELTDDAKDAARAWYRRSGFDDDWYESVFDDFEAVCDILGVDLRTSPVRLMGGDTRSRPHIYFRGFWSQGDGACYEATSAYAPKAGATIRQYAPRDTELHAIADALQAIQRRNFYQLRTEVRHRGRYYHEYCMAITVERDSPTGQDMTTDAREIMTEALRDLARWLYRQLEREHGHQTSDAVVDEAIAANGITFTLDGRRFA